MAEESKIERKTCIYAESLGIMNMKLGSPTDRGKPDRVFIFKNGQHLYIEFKAPKKKPSLQQVRFMEKLTNQGCIVAWVDDFQAAADIIDRIQYACENTGINPVLTMLK